MYFVLFSFSFLHGCSCLKLCHFLWWYDDQAVYVTLREAEMRSTSPIPTWEIPIWKDISPRQKKVNEALKLINTTLDELIAICKVHLFSTLILMSYMFGSIEILSS